MDDILFKKHGSKVFQYLKSRTSVLIDFSVPLMVYKDILAATVTGTKYLLQDECNILVNTLFIRKMPPLLGFISGFSEILSKILIFYKNFIIKICKVPVNG